MRSMVPVARSFALKPAIGPRRTMINRFATLTGALSRAICCGGGSAATAREPVATAKPSAQTIRLPNRIIEGNVS